MYSVYATISKVDFEIICGNTAKAVSAIIFPCNIFIYTTCCNNYICGAKCYWKRNSCAIVFCGSIPPLLKTNGVPINSLRTTIAKIYFKIFFSNTAKAVSPIVFPCDVRIYTTRCNIYICGAKWHWKCNGCTIVICGSNSPLYFEKERMIKMPLNAKDARIFIKFNDDGTRDDTRIEGANLEIIPPQPITKMVDGEEVVVGQTEEIIAAAVYEDGSYDEFDLTGYIETSYEDYMLYCGNSPDGKEYVRNMETGEPMEKPPYVPTTEEKLASLDAEYQQKFDEINNAIIIAVTEGDSELRQELVAEKAALKEEYTMKRGEL